MSQIETYTFSNGFRLIYEKPKSTAPLAAIMGFINVGSIEEPMNIKGASHFIEHMCFKGTHKETSQSLNERYDRIGAFFNAVTDLEYTCYIVKCNETYLKQCIHTFSDMMMNSTFKKKFYDLEKHVVTEEVLRSSSNPEAVMGALVQGLLYSGSTYELDVDDIEFHKDPKCLPYNKVLDFYDDWYQPKNMVLSVVTHIPFETVKKFLKGTYYMNRSRTTLNTYCVNTNFLMQDNIRIAVKPHSGITQIYIGIAFRTCSYENTDKYAIAFLANIIGGSMGARLFTLLREKNGLSYSSKCSVSNYNPSGHIYIKTAVDETKVLKNGQKMGALQLLIYLLNKLYKYGVTKQEVDIYRGFIEGTTIRNLEDTSKQCGHNGFHFMKYGKESLVPYDKQFERFYKDLSVDDINIIIKKYLRKKLMSVVLVGNEKKIPSLDVIRDICNKFVG